MVDYSSEAKNQLQELILRYCDYHYGVEYGTSAFWHWYYQVRDYSLSLDSICEKEGESLVYQMQYWGKIIYSCHFVENECMIYIHEFKFNKRNFNAWLHHRTLKESLMRKIVREVLREYIK